MSGTIAGPGRQSSEKKHTVSGVAYTLQRRQ